jgi:hypothetical protein
MRRSLRLAILSRGFTSKQANHLIGHKGFKDIREMWDIFDRQHRTLPVMIGNDDWQYVRRAVEMRNKMVHGQQASNPRIATRTRTTLYFPNATKQMPYLSSTSGLSEMI